MSRLSILLVATLVATVPAAEAQGQGDLLVLIDDLTPHELQSAGFELTSDQEVRIRAVGADETANRRRVRWASFIGDFEDETWKGNAWVINATTREVVWELADSRTRSAGDDLREFEGTVRLPAGRYVAHYWSQSYYRLDSDWQDGEMRRRRYYDDGLSEGFELAINGTGQSLGRMELARTRDASTANAFVSFVGLGDEERQRIGFTVSRPTEVEVYAVGEIIDESLFDYGVILNVETRERVWELDRWESRHAGGARKNRMDRTRLRLEPGRYAAIFATDGNHSIEEWNGHPPYDPEFWGMTVSFVNPSDRGNVTTYEYEPVPQRDVIAALTEVGDSDARVQGFTLTRPLDVRILAIGEGQSGRMYDYGWIVDARTRRKVWEMDYYDTDPAGGDSKNRMASETVRLEPGDYLVYYVTDGSHSFEDWNTSAPLDGDLWGITLFGPAGFDRSAVRPYDPDADTSILARLVTMRDNEHARRRFRLDREAQVRVYAMGEGVGSTMYDYAWIEDARTGRTVWEMTARRSEHAGGGDKNRVVNEVITLPAGEYELWYESDGSHHFGDWNTTPPDDPFNWGVTVSLEN